MRIKFKITSLLLAAVFLFSVLKTAPAHEPGGQMKIKIRRDRQGAPAFITGDLPKLNGTDTSSVEQYLRENAPKYGLDGDGQYKVEAVKKDDLGMTHVVVRQKAREIPIYGKKLKLHLEGGGNISSINGSVKAGLSRPDGSAEPTLNEDRAGEIARADVGAPSETKAKAELMWYDYKGTFYLVYVVNLFSSGPSPVRWRVFVDARDGRVIDKYNALFKAAADGKGVFGDRRILGASYDGFSYTLRDKGRNVTTYDMKSRKYGGIVFSDTDGHFDSSYQAPAVDGHYYAGLVRDYFLNEHGLRSYDGEGAEIAIRVHYGAKMNNALWDCSGFNFGDGDGIIMRPLTAGLDVVAHEFTHAVVDSAVGLEYRGQSGILHESLADVFGQIIERKYNHDTDWLIAEDIMLGGKALRSMEKPSLFDQRSHYSEYVELPEDEKHDNGGVHIYSGILNAAAYNLAAAVGDDKTAKIYFRAVMYYLTEVSGFEDARDALLHSALDLYPGGGETAAVARAFNSVGISDKYPPAAPTGLKAHLAGDGFNLFWNANSEDDLAGYNIYRSTDGGEYTLVNTGGPVRETTYSVRCDGGSSYSFIVKAVDISGNESGSAGPVTVRTEEFPAAPAGLAASQVTPFSITWTWLDESDNEEGFRVYDRKGNLLAALGPDVTQYREDNLEPSTGYSRVVKSFRGKTESAQYTAASIKTSPFTGPGKLTGVAGPAAVVWTWEDRTDYEEGYKLFDSGGNLIAATGPNVTSFREEGLEPEKKYRRYVVAFKGEILSGKSGTASVKTTDSLKPVSSLKGRALSHDTIRWEWRDNAVDEDGYLVYGEDGALLATLPRDATEFIREGLKEGATYWITVVPYKDHFQTGKPKKSSARTKTFSVPKPAAVSGTAGSEGTIIWSWRLDDPRADKIRVYDAGKLIAEVDAAAGRYTETGLMPGRTYSRTLKAYNTAHGKPSSGVVARGGTIQPS
ncbi:MAG: M4 family metallopeptidase [Peptococcaceae bacterium]|nr:M4 family metallopeptidase [Peptococcaceae bacterium]